MGMTGGPGQIGRVVLPAVAAVAAAGLLAALGLAVRGSDPARADTVVRAAQAASVELADGTTRAATVGMTVPKGATVRTDPGGSASLVSSGRTVLLGSATALTVVDGRREQLRSGLVFIDARRSPGVAVDAGAATVTATRGALARIERGTLLRAVAYRSTLHLRPTGRRSDVRVTSLHQVQVPDGGLPGAETPIALTPRDVWERSYVLDLVTADADLSALADGLDRNPASSAAVLRALGARGASYVAAAPAAAGEKPSETALAFVIASAAKRPAAFVAVRQDREQGGSWGVVAAIVQADVGAVSAALDTVLNPTEGPAILAAPAPGSGPRATTGTGTGSSPAPGSGPAGRPSSRPTSSPSPSADPVSQVVTTVRHLLPTPTPVAGPATPLQPSPSPPASPNLGGIGLNVG